MSLLIKRFFLTYTMIFSLTAHNAVSSANRDSDGEISVETKVETKVVAHPIPDDAPESLDNSMLGPPPSANTTQLVSIPPTGTSDTAAPTITLNGPSKITLIQGAHFQDLGASVVDDLDGNLGEIKAGNLDELNINVVGRYTMRYTAKDLAGNVNTAERAVIVTPSPDTLVTTWQTDVVGAPSDNQIVIDTDPTLSYRYMVFWGDGHISENVTGGISHTYKQPGTYTVVIAGEFPHLQLRHSQ